MILAQIHTQTVTARALLSDRHSAQNSAKNRAIDRTTFAKILIVMANCPFIFLLLLEIVNKKAVTFIRLRLYSKQ